MEDGPGGRAVPVGHQDCQYHQAGIQEKLIRQSMNDDRSSFTWRIWSRMTIRRTRSSTNDL
eukprot:5281344-Heterocapsa_arctica.AAC.1